MQTYERITYNKLQIFPDGNICEVIFSSYVSYRIYFSMQLKLVTTLVHLEPCSGRKSNCNSIFLIELNIESDKKS